MHYKFAKLIEEYLFLWKWIFSSFNSS